MSEFVDTKVTDDQTTNGWRIALIKIGIVIALPSFLTGAELGSKLGLMHTIFAVTGGCLILAILCSLTGTVAAKSRLPTAVITQFSFGRKGALIINLVLAITLIGWFSVTLELFSNTLVKFSQELWQQKVTNSVFIVAGGLLMLITTIFGFKALNKLSNFVVPVMFLVLLLMAYLAISSSDELFLANNSANTTAIGLAISAVVGGPAAGTVIFPDIGRFAKTVNHGRGAAILSYSIGMPLIFILVAITAIATNEKDLVMIMLGLGLGIPSLLFLVFTAWTTNAGNLYSGSLFISTLLSQLTHRTVVIIGGIAGICFSLLGITDLFIPFLVALGVTVPPIAGIYVTDFYLRSQNFDLEILKNQSSYSLPAFLSWGGGIAIGYLSVIDVIKLTSIAACDSILISAMLFFIIKKVFASNNSSNKN